jgi:hypothetical protein
MAKYTNQKEYRKAWKLAHPERVAAIQRAYDKAHKDDHAAYYLANRERMLIRQKLYALEHKEERSEWAAAHYLKNREDLLSATKLYQREHRTERTAHDRERLKTDPLFRLSKYLRTRTWEALRVKSWRKTTLFSKYIGCTLEELKLHLEKQFQPEMTWDNYGKWHIDHIIPLSSATTVEELYKLCHYSNLQPLWAEDNLRKHAKY